MMYIYSVCTLHMYEVPDSALKVQGYIQWVDIDGSKLNKHTEDDL